MALALEGIKVIETAFGWAGPTASRFLADWGADVIKVEHPVRGEIMRAYKNTSIGLAGIRAGAVAPTNIDYEPENHNRNKRSMTLDLSQEAGQQIMYRLLEKADVLLSTFRPRELTRFKLTWEILSQLNPRLIHANLTGYGEKGPDTDDPGFDVTAFWARSGFIHMLQSPGAPPAVTPTASGDRMAGPPLALGIMTALFMRERTGLGQKVETSLFNFGVFALSSEIGGALVTGQDLRQVDRKNLMNAIGTFYETKDGRWLRLSLFQSESYWGRFCQAIERVDLEHDARFSSYEPRIKNHDTLFEILEPIFRARTLAEWRVRLRGMPWAPVQNLPEVVNDPQARANDFFMPYEHHTFGHMELIANPVKLSRSPEKVRRPAPQFGQHTEEVLLEHGYTWQDIERFHTGGVIA